MQQDYKFKQKPKFSTDSKEVTLLVEDFQDIMEIVSRVQQEIANPGKSTPTQATTNDKVTVQQTPRPRCPNGPDTYLACPRVTYRPRLLEESTEPPVYEQVEPEIFETYMDETKNNSPLSFLSSRLSQFTKATRIFTTRDYTHTNVAAEFHQACDNIPNTLVIIKSGQYIAGGYTEVAWSSLSDWTFIGSDSMSAYLFSVNRQSVYPLKVKGKDIQVREDWGPIFGGGDLTVRDDYKEDGGYSFLGRRSYDCPKVDEPKELLCGSEDFTIDEYEVYKLE